MSKKYKGFYIYVCLVLAFVFVTSHVVSGQKPTIARGCSLPGCHTPQPNILQGHLKGVSARAEMLQIDTGVLWTVKFDDKTKTKNWDQPVGRLPRDREVVITYVEKDGELYATLVNVKRPLTIDPAKVINAAQMKKIVEEKRAVVIDARPAVRYHEGHIPGTTFSIWFAEFDKHLDKLPKDKDHPIVYY